MPGQPEDIAQVQMVEIIAVNKLQPATIPFTRQLLGLDVESPKLDAAKARIISTMLFYEDLLGDRTYFVKEEMTLADIVARTMMPSLPMFGIFP